MKYGLSKLESISPFYVKKEGKRRSYLRSYPNNTSSSFKKLKFRNSIKLFSKSQKETRNPLRTLPYGSVQVTFVIFPMINFEFIEQPYNEGIETTAAVNPI